VASQPPLPFLGNRADLERRWLELTRSLLPAVAAARGFPVRFDHCFQRIFLDAACAGRWTDVVSGRPAYRQIDEERLARAVSLAEAVLQGDEDLHELNRRSLAARERL
jgi:hypothetical protein